MLENPGDALVLLGRKLLLSLNSLELPINHPYLLGREVAPILRVLFGFSVVFPFALLGIGFGFKKKLPIGLLTGCAVFYLATLVAYYVADRYRILLLPMLIPLAGLGVARLYHFVRDTRPRSWWLPLVTLAAAFGLTQLPMESPSARTRALSGGYNLMGKAEADAGDLVAAEAYFRKAIRMAGPGKGAVPLANLGLLLERLGDQEGAWELYRRSASADPEYRFCRIRLALMSERRGDLETALGTWRELAGLAADPTDYQKQIRRLEKLIRGGSSP
jgi:tetratricopeptide (TPR) repeat protein